MRFRVESPIGVFLVTVSEWPHVNAFGKWVWNAVNEETSKGVGGWAESETDGEIKALAAINDMPAYNQWYQRYFSEDPNEAILKAGKTAVIITDASVDEGEAE